MSSPSSVCHTDLRDEGLVKVHWRLSNVISKSLHFSYLLEHQYVLVCVTINSDTWSMQTCSVTGVPSYTALLALHPPALS
jgi:hypothetical protein